MRSKIFERILDNTPKEVEQFVDWYVDLYTFVKNLLKKNHMGREELFTKIGIVGSWVIYDWDIPNTRPPEYGRYLIVLKDGKMHFEIWNGSGWAYSANKAVVYWAKILTPINKLI